MLALLLAVSVATSAASAEPGGSQDSLVAQATTLYYRGDHQGAAAAFGRAIATSSMTVEPWLSGARALEELGETAKALRWYRTAADMPAADAEAAVQLGWALFRSGAWAEAAAAFERALVLRPQHPAALTGLARARLGLKRDAEALTALDRLPPDAPFPSLTWLIRGQAQESQDLLGQAAQSYKQAVSADSFNATAREALARSQLRERRFDEAFKNFRKMLDSDPRNPRLKALLRKITPLVTRAPSAILSPALSDAPLPESRDGEGKVPLLRVGIGSDAMGRPRARTFAAFTVHPGFTVVDAKTGKTLARGGAGERWQARLASVSGKDKAGKKFRRLVVELADPGGATRVKTGSPVVIRPESPSAGAITVNDSIGKILRGELEIAPEARRRTLRLVNLVDLENYTHGVLSAEMPIRSPLEALKAQAVVARSHALYIKSVTRRHRRDGYDVCDEQHCQMYGGGRAENERSRAVVTATRGRIATYGGRVAHVIYSSNCGGRTQSGKDIGWGNVPYWLGVHDAAEAGQETLTPARLRRRLSEYSPAYCRPSNYVHASHFRWSLLVPFAEAQEKIHRKHGIGRLLRLTVAKRSPAGNVTQLLIVGSKRKARISSEMAIRGLLGAATLRSTLFIVDIERGPDGKALTVSFQGGGWGHGVGLCQSGAMGRAEAGQLYDEIIKAYFPGTALGQLPY